MKRENASAPDGWRTAPRFCALAITGSLVLGLVLHCGQASAAGGRTDALRGRQPASAQRSGLRAVSAGRDRRVVVGDVIELSGHIGAALRGQAEHWTVVAAPRAARGKRTARLFSSMTLAPRFRPRVLGRYTLRLTVGRGKRRRSDTANLTAVPGTPMVAIDTHAGTPAAPAIRVGPDTYHATANPTLLWGSMFVLVLDRKSLRKVDADTFALTENNAWRRSVTDFLSRPTIDDGDLVIVSTWPGHNDAATEGSKPLTRLGTELFDPPAQPNAYYSAIGVPGMHAGEADEEYLPPHAPEAALGMRGYLSPDQHLDYGYIPSTQIIRHYGAENRCAGDKTGNGETCSEHEAGFWVEASDRYTLAPIPDDAHFFPTGTNASAGLVATQMANKLDSFPHGDLVTVESLSARSGDGSYLSPVGHNIDRATMDKLALAVTRVGGTRDGFNRAAQTVPSPASHGAVYTLVGWAGAGEGKGAESAANVNGVGDTARLDLVLRPDHHSQLRPAEVSRNGDRAGELSALMLDRGKAKWPLSDDPGAMRAFAYLGSTDETLGRDPRSAYWSQDLDQSATNALIAKLEHVDYPGGKVDYTKEQFLAARSELIKELGWVGKVRAYLTDLSSPFAEEALSSWITAQTVADKVYESVKPPEDEAVMSWLDFVKTILHLAGPLTDDVSGHVADLLDLGVWAYGATKSGAPTNGEFRFKANELGAELVARARDAKPTYDRIGDAVVSDYAALAELGTHAGCNPADAQCPAPWALTKAGRVQASVDVYRASEALAYETLMPLAYWTYRMNPADLVKPPIYQEQYKCGVFHPYSNVPTKASATLLQMLDPAHGQNEYQLYAEGQPRGIHDYISPPPDEIVNRMFDPVSRSGDPKAGGLGISQAQFMVDQKHHQWGAAAFWPEIECRWQP